MLHLQCRSAISPACRFNLQILYYASSFDLKPPGPAANWHFSMKTNWKKSVWERTDALMSDINIIISHRRYPSQEAGADCGENSQEKTRISFPCRQPLIQYLGWCTYLLISSVNRDGGSSLRQMLWGQQVSRSPVHVRASRWEEEVSHEALRERKISDAWRSKWITERQLKVFLRRRSKIWTQFVQNVECWIRDPLISLFLIYRSVRSNLRRLNEVTGLQF